MLVPLGIILTAWIVNFSHEVYLAYFVPEVKQPEDFYLIDEASIYVKDTALFVSGVKNVAHRLDIPPEWLMAVMYMESRFNPAVENHRGSGAVGLIQFMVPTVREINMRLGRRLYMQDIQKMSAVEQLELVENYLQTVRRRRGEFNSLTDLYLAVLYPKAINRGLTYKLFSKPSKRYRQNSGLDMNKDGIVSVKDIDTRMARMFPKAYNIKKLATD
ncbi:MAG: transglycosylase SLT domain-containing protein [Bacteroidota bacterium]